MQVNKHNGTWILLLWMVCIQGCVEPYSPEIPDAGKSMVIEGLLSDSEGYYYVRVSRSAAYYEPDYIPLSGCMVEVTDQTGNSVLFNEREPGLYEQWISQDFLVIGNLYKLLVTHEGNRYESSFQELLQSAPIGETYYEVESRETTDPEITHQGIQFYTEFDVPEGFAENYRWELEETWEYHSNYPITFYWDGSRILPPGSVNSDLYKCWNTASIHNIFTATTRLSKESRISEFPLNYVSNETDRLKVKYSLLVKQYALSDEAYEYWHQLQQISQESGGLYDTQPPQLRGNMFNAENDDQLVLGYFSVSGMAEKRIFVSEDFNFFPVFNDCSPFLPLGGYPRNNPYYLVEHEGQLMMAKDLCFDCTLLGGTTIKPGFWE